MHSLSNKNQISILLAGVLFLHAHLETREKISDERRAISNVHFFKFIKAKYCSK